MSKIFVLGLEPFNLRLLEQLPDSDSHEFLELLSARESVEVEPGFSFEALLARARERERRNGPADAILNYWDFPGCCLAPVLSRELGLAAAEPEAVAKCEHKYWARSEMAASVPEATPRFRAVDPFKTRSARDIGLAFPFWIKPVVSHSSYLGFKVRDDHELDEALESIRARIDHFGVPFDEFLRHVDVPASIREVGGRCCIAEEIISADRQVTLEGYAWRGSVETVGWIDSIRGDQSTSSFSRYEYPSNLPSSVLGRMKELARRLVTHIGYDNAPFNVEFFWDERDDRISVLEINSRISKSHCPLFHLVDGASHQQVAIDLALGRAPSFRRGGGDWPFASKFMVRLFQDGEVTRVPNETEIHMVEARYPEGRCQVLVKEGQRLSHLPLQDSYSFEIANIYFGGRNEHETREKHADALEIMPFEVHLTAPLEAEHR